jgi:histidinol-phosphate phosphatase family protein
MAWVGPGIPDVPSVRGVAGIRELAGWHADAVLVDRPDPLAAVRWGWSARAHCLLLPLEHEAVRRWGPMRRLAWGSLHAHGIVEPSQAGSFQAAATRLDLDRVGLWPDGEAMAEVDPAHPDVEILERACERALARHRGLALRAALFVDRDGTLVREVGYLSDPADLELLPGVAAALRSAHAAGAVIVVVSNQSGIGRGLFPARRAHAAMARLRQLLRREGVELDAVYFCPHRPEDGCACRKPGTALLERAAEDLNLSLRASVMVGDKRLDAWTGQAAGGVGVLVRTGYGREEEVAIGAGGTRAPDGVFDDLGAAVRWWLAGHHAID